MMPMTYWMIPLVAALIGWGTNVLAVKMLFRPRDPVRLFGLFPVQGVIPRRKSPLARSVAQIFEEEFFSSREIVEQLAGLDLQGELEGVASDRLDRFLDGLKAKIPMVGMFLKGELVETVRSELLGQITASLPDFKARLTSEIEEKVSIQQIVEQKVLSFSTDKMEEIALRVARRELRSIELLGGLLGFLIGLAQVAILVFL